MEERTNEEYISLFEASKFCPYSEPYLRLRARQGKLKSIKFGKKWMTTALWVEDYVKRSDQWKEKIAAKKALAGEKQSADLTQKTEVLNVLAAEQEMEPEVSQPPMPQESEVLAMGDLPKEAEVLNVLAAEQEMEPEVSQPPMPQESEVLAMGDLPKEAEVLNVLAAEQEMEPEVSQPPMPQESETLTINDLPRELIDEEARENVWGEPRLVDRSPISDFALVVGSALMFVLAIFFAVSSEDNPYVPLNPFQNISNSIQAAVKNGAETKIAEFSNDLIMPACRCPLNGRKLEDSLNKSETSFGPFTQQNILKFLWPWQ